MRRECWPEIWSKCCAPVPHWAQLHTNPVNYASVSGANFVGSAPGSGGAGRLVLHRRHAASAAAQSLLASSLTVPAATTPRWSHQLAPLVITLPAGPPPSRQLADRGKSRSQPAARPAMRARCVTADHHGCAPSWPRPGVRCVAGAARRGRAPAAIVVRAASRAPQKRGAGGKAPRSPPPQQQPEEGDSSVLGSALLVSGTAVGAGAVLGSMERSNSALRLTRLPSSAPDAAQQHSACAQHDVNYTHGMHRHPRAPRRNARERLPCISGRAPGRRRLLRRDGAAAR